MSSIVGNCGAANAMTPHRIVNAPELGEPSGFSHAVIAAGRTVHLAGQIGAGATIAEQFDSSAANMLVALRAAGGEPENLVSLQIFVTDVPGYKASTARDRPRLAKALRPPLPRDGAVRRDRAVRARGAGGADGRRGPAGLTDGLAVWHR